MKYTMRDQSSDLKIHVISTGIKKLDYLVIAN